MMENKCDVLQFFRKELAKYIPVNLLGKIKKKEKTVSKFATK